MHMQDGFMIAKKGAFVVVADGRGATIYKVATRVGGVKLDDIETIEADIPARSSLMGRDRPGRTNDAAGRKSAIEPRDLHESAEDAFAVEVAARVNTLAAKAKRGVVIFAAPRFLGEVRKHLNDSAKAAIVAAEAKELRNLPVAEIEKAVERLDG